MKKQEVHMEDGNINKEDKASYTPNNAKKKVLKSSDYLSKNMENLLYLVTKFRIITAIFWICSSWFIYQIYEFQSLFHVT